MPLLIALLLGESSRTSCVNERGRHHFAAHLSSGCLTTNKHFVLLPDPGVLNQEVKVSLNFDLQVWTCALEAEQARGLHKQIGAGYGHGILQSCQKRKLIFRGCNMCGLADG